MVAPSRVNPRRKPVKASTHPVRRALVTLLAMALLGGTAWGGWVWWRGDPNFNEALALRAQLAKLRESGASRDDMRTAFDNLRQVSAKLTPEQRDQLWSDRDREERMQREMDAFFQLSPAERKVYLDKRIDEMERWRKAAEARNRGGSSASSRGGESRGGGPGGWEGRSRGGSQRSQMTRQERNRRMLNRSSPKQRAQFTEFLTQMRERRKERGLPDITWPSRRG